MKRLKKKLFSPETTAEAGAFAHPIMQKRSRPGRRIARQPKTDSKREAFENEQ